MGFKGFVPVLAFLAVINFVYSCTPQEQAACKLPSCLCPSLDIPGGLTPVETPQIVYLTFDDGVSVVNYHFYEELIFPRKNPNGAPISATFYVVHEYTNYSMIHDLYRKGHEIALHSITHNPLTDYWKNLNTSMWEWEVSDQRGQVSHFAKIPKGELRGFRAPFLQGGGDRMMEVLYDEGLTYECSRPTWAFQSPGLWPYTADYDQKFQDCQIQPCSVESYPGFWVVPLVDWNGGDGSPCAFLDTCKPVPETAQDTFELMKVNFERHYNGNRAPFGVFTHASMFNGGENDVPSKERLAGYKQFLDYLQAKTDVYIVSVARALEWLKRPTKLANLATFTPWQHTELDSTCLQPRNCYFAPEDTPFDSARYMPSCQSCSRKYPWLKNPYGSDQ